MPLCYTTKSLADLQKQNCPCAMLSMSIDGTWVNFCWNSRLPPEALKLNHIATKSQLLLRAFKRSFKAFNNLAWSIMYLITQETEASLQSKQEALISRKRALVYTYTNRSFKAFDNLAWSIMNLITQEMEASLQSKQEALISRKRALVYAYTNSSMFSKGSCAYSVLYLFFVCASALCKKVSTLRSTMFKDFQRKMQRDTKKTVDAHVHASRMRHSSELK
ncbi:hypothetical protein Tco_0812731, partial [Tanacetum coccineum]